MFPVGLYAASHIAAKSISENLPRATSSDTKQSSRHKEENEGCCCCCCSASKEDIHRVVEKERTFERFLQILMMVALIGAGSVLLIALFLALMQSNR